MLFPGAAFARAAFRGTRRRRPITFGSTALVAELGIVESVRKWENFGVRRFLWPWLLSSLLAASLMLALAGFCFVHPEQNDFRSFYRGRYGGTRGLSGIPVQRAISGSAVHPSAGRGAVLRAVHFPAVSDGLLGLDCNPDCGVRLVSA